MNLNKCVFCNIGKKPAKPNFLDLYIQQKKK